MFKSSVNRAAFCAAAFFFFISLLPLDALAANKINSVSIKFTIEGYDEDGCPQIEARSSADHYTLGSVDLELSSTDDDETVIDYKNAKYSIDLTADDGYAFYITKNSQVKLNGCGATYVKASRQNSGTTLHVVMKFTQLDDFCGDLSEIFWESDGRVTWEPAQNAKLYKIALYRDDKVIKSQLYTGAAAYDCRPLMLEEGNYSVKITPESGDKRGEALRSETFTVSKEMANVNQANYGLQTETIVTGNGTGPDAVSEKVINAGWKNDGRGWWYQNNSGDYIQYNWLKSDDGWYFFDSAGYMVTGSVITWQGDQYYVDVNGKLLTSCTVPDGRKADGEGKLSGQAINAQLSQTLPTSGPGAQ